MAFTAAAFKTITRSALVAAVLGASSLVAAPAFAESSFTLRIEGGQGLAQDQRYDRHNSWNGNPGYRMRCLTNREVVRGVSAYGYGQVDIVGEYAGDRLELRAVKGNWLYGMRIDKCTGQVDRLQRIGRAYSGYDGGRHDDGGYRSHSRSGGGFQFQFNFGN